MSAELAHWLIEHQSLLLPRWESVVSLKLSRMNGHAATLITTQLLVNQTSTLVQSLEQIYAGFIQSAYGDRTLLDTQLDAISATDELHHLISLPDLLDIVFQFRQLAWEMLQCELADTARTFGLMNALETLLEHTIELLARSWMVAAETTISARVEEAEFIAQSMNVAIEQADRTAVQLSSINEVSQRLSSSLESADSTEIIEVVGSKLMEILQVAHIGIWLPDETNPCLPGTICLSMVQSWGSTDTSSTEMRLVVSDDGTPSDDIVVQSYTQSQMIIVINPPPDPSTQGPWYAAECGVIALPLLVKDRARGVVVMQDFLPTEHLSSAQQDTVRAVVNQAAIALDNVQLYAQVRRFNNELGRLVDQRTHEVEAEKDRLRTLHEIAAEVSSTLDLDALLHTSLEALARITRVEFGSIMLMDQDTEHLVNRAVLGQDMVNAFTRFPVGRGVAGWVAQHKKPALISDVTQDKRWVPLPTDDPLDIERKHRGSMIAVPLIAHNERLGVLTLSHPEPGYFNEDHLRLLTASAGAIAIGIHNANLYATIVSEMERRSELLRRQQTETSQIEAILQSLSDGVLVCDTYGNLLSANAASALILQRNVEELVLENLHDILKHLLRQRVDELPLSELLSRPTDTNNQPRIFRSTVQTGKQVLGLTMGPVLKDDGELVGALVVVRDKTREIESERLKTEFIGTMSHELRTPMTAIKGFTQLLVMGSLGPINDTQSEFLFTIQTNAERMISIINDVLELTKIETGSIDLEIRPLHLAEALSGVVTELQKLADEREHSLTISIPPGLPLVKADATRLHQILYHLISNGLKYTPRGGQVSIEAHEAVLENLPQHVRDRVSAQRRYTQINVRDSGVGIAPHEQEKVFDRFYRTDNPLKVEAGGTGLGLSLTRPLVELLGGRIWVESTPNEGSTFSFILPAV